MEITNGPEQFTNNKTEPVLLFIYLFICFIG